MLIPISDGDYPQHYGIESALTYIWDVPTLSWIKNTGSAGGGGGPVTIADGADVAEGATTDAAVITDTTGTVSGKLRGLVKWAYERMPASLGQKAMAASLPVVVASDQSALAITAAALPLPTGASTSALQTQPGVDIGDVTVNNAAGATAVNIQDGGNSITVDGTVTANQGTASANDWRVDERRGLTPAFTSVSISTSGDNTIVAADATKKVKVASYLLVADAAVTVKWKSGAATDLSGAMSFAANGGVAAAPIAPAGGHWLETAVNQALVVNLGGAIGVRGHVGYFLEA